MAEKSRSLTALAALLCATLLLAGCPSLSTRPQAPASPANAPTLPPATPANPALPPPAPPTERPLPPPRENRLSPATRSLVNQSHAMLARGDMDGASTTLDRALRIEPSNPLLWIEMGRVRIVEGDPHQAESCARKALALGSGDHAAQNQAGHLLIDALRAQGRNPEAQEVESRPYMR